MKTRHLFGGILLFMMVMLTMATGSRAQSKPWAKFSNGVLTLTYGAKPAEAQSTVKCEKCGKALAATHKFCPNCGTARPEKKKTVFEVPLNAQDMDELPWFKIQDEVKKVVIAASFKQVTQITSTAYWFFHMEKLTTIVGLENLRTSNVTKMQSMFYKCESLTSLNLSSFNTSKVTNMHTMFCFCKSLTSLNLSTFDTRNVTDMSGMIGGCESLTSLNISSFDTRNVTDMSQLFYECKSLTSLDISHFDMGKVERVTEMFADCTSLKKLYLPAASWDIDKIHTRGKDRYQPIKDVFSKCPAEIIMK